MAPHPTARYKLSAQTVIISIGGTGSNHDMVRSYWPQRIGTAPAPMITGMPSYVDGRVLAITADNGVRLINRDQMFNHAIRILSGPSSMWFDTLDRLLPAPLPAWLRHPGHRTVFTAPPPISHITNNSGSS